MKKRIAVVVDYFPALSETFIVNQVNSLLELGADIRLFSYHSKAYTDLHASFYTYNLLEKVSYFNPPPVSKLKRLQVFYSWTLQHFLQIKWRLYFKSLNFFKYGKDAYTLKLFFEAQWFLLPFEFDIIHAHFGMYGQRIAYLKSLGFFSKDIKFITSFHGYDLVPNRLNHYKVAYEHLFEECNVFTVNTPYLEGLLKQVIPKKGVIKVLPVGLDTNYFKRKSDVKNSSTFRLVFCGRLIRLKGPDLAIEILYTLHQRGYNTIFLEVIGDGSMLKILKHKVSILGLDDFVFFHGMLNQDAIKELYERANVFLLPGRHDSETGRAETQGLVIQEAQAMELPVVISNVGGMFYGMLPEKSGFVLEEENIEGFSDAIETLYNSEGLRASMGKAGRVFVESNYDSKILASQLLDIYKSLFNI